MANNKSYLLGQETELAIRFQEVDCQHPGNKVIFDYIARAVKSMVHTKPGKRNFIQDQFFVQNGGAIYYEHHPQSIRKGLLECATPECHSAQELLLYQRAQEALLIQALPLAKDMLEQDGIFGELSLLKNCRDFAGNTYGSQENYDSYVAKSWKWLSLNALLLGYIPIAILLKVCYLFLLFPFVLAIFLCKSAIEVLLMLTSFEIFERLLGKILPLKSLQNPMKQGLSSLDFDIDETEEYLLKLEYSLFYPLFWLSYKPLIIIYNRFAFGPQYRAIASHIISRIIYTGAGTLLENNDFMLSEKALSINSLLRRSIHRHDKPLFDCGNLIKDYELAIWELFILKAHSWLSLLKSSQRLQIAFSDSNRCQVAELLKLGVSSLVVRMANEGWLKDAPQFVDPIGCLGKISQDLSLSKTFPMKNQHPMTALAIQNWYLQRAKDYLKQSTVSMEDHEIVRLWNQTLDLLGKDPQSLIGRLDWVTKRYLLETSGADLNYWERKKIDLKYHDLGQGYFESLQTKGVILDLVDSKDIQRAIWEPSSSHRAKVRSHFIKSLELEDQPITVSWSQASIGRWSPKVVSLTNYKDDKTET